MVRLTKNEMALYDHVRKSHKDVPIDDLVAMFYKDRKKPKHPNGSVAAMMRTLMLKAEVLGLPRLRRTSRLGVSSPATYRVR
jgi:hypothetical protein